MPEKSLLQEVSDLLKSDTTLVSSEGRLLKNAVTERALRLDPSLVRLLLGNEATTKQFFKDVDGVKFFDRDGFVRFLNLKDFLPDSYTAFEQKIGLATPSSGLLSKNESVVLNWPYKDCVLEGDMKREDDARDEIFYNEVIAPDQVDRLLELKALTAFKKIDAEGEHVVTGFTRDAQGVLQENLIVRGNNLLALRSLEKTFTGKIKLIYIDPPYNRPGDESTFYNDSFNHSTWLTFMKNRLEVAKNLLRNDGLIFISIDDTESAYLKVLCDSIFGDTNFLATIAYERSGVSGLGQGGSFLVNTHESILCFARNKPDLKIYDVSGEADFGHEEMKRYNKILVGIGPGKEVGRFVAPSTGEEVVIMRHEQYEIETIKLGKFDERQEEIRGQFLANFEKIFRTTSVQEENEFQNKILSFCKDGLFSAKYLVSRGRSKGQWLTTHYINGQIFVWLKDSAGVIDGEIKKTNKLSDFWDHGSIPKADLANEGGVKLRRGKNQKIFLSVCFELPPKKTILF